MTERTHIPSSPACGHWETLLADALDGLLKPEDEATFTAHMAACAHCAILFDEARKGREWLSFLSDDPEVPEGLVDKILAQTVPGQNPAHFAVAGHAAALPLIPAWQRPGFMGHVRRFAEPRLMMTAAMAFFSIALTLNLTGIRFTQLRMADLRPVAIRANVERSLNMASVPVIRYYDHLRFVYEVESRMRELRGNMEDDQQDENNQKDTRPAGSGESRQNYKDGGSQQDSPAQRSSKPESRPATDTLNDFLETSLNMSPDLQGQPCSPAPMNLRRTSGSAQFGGSTSRARERSRLWTA